MSRIEQRYEQIIYVLEITHDGMTSSTVSGRLLLWLQDIEAEIRYWLEEKGALNKPGPATIEWRIIECPDDGASPRGIGGGTCVLEALTEPGADNVPGSGLGV